MPRKSSADATPGFAALGLDERLIEALTALGYEEPTPIQRELIPPILQGRDVIGQAATGTGKTAAFALPILQRLVGMEDRGQPAAIVLVPTRELAMQVAEAMHRYGRPFGMSVLPIYGGQAYGQQLRALKRGVDVIVATPGRALDHVRRGTMPLDRIAIAVLDEADEMLDMGFADDIEAVLSETAATRQTVLVSATLPPRIASIAKSHLQDPLRIQVAGDSVPEGELPKIRQTAYLVQRAYKLPALARVLDIENPTSALVFCRTRTEVDELAENLTSKGYRAEALHGGMTQDQRTRVMKRLKAGTTDLVIATDVAARGLDVKDLSHVFNYNLPSAAESYVHRIGRVGRAGREGVAITLAEPREHRMLRAFEQLTRQKIEVTPVPTVADLQARRMDLTRASIRESMLEGALDPFRVVVEALGDEFDLMDIALAAIKLVHQNGSAETDEVEIPTAMPPRSDHGDKSKFAAGRGPRAAGGRGPRRQSAGMARLFVNAGRAAGMRPQDLVGAIAGEAGINGRDIGAIEIADKFSLVEVPEESAQKVIRAVSASKIKGRKVVIRRDERE